MNARCCALLLLALGSEQAWPSMNLGSWMPLYQGIDFARGANIDDTRIPVPQLVTVARIDLTDPDIRLLDRCGRSEEHTSELQSRQYLVCRLLLEKKKKKRSCSANHQSNILTSECC